MSKPLGVANEDAIKLSAAERKVVRRRSFKLLAALAVPQKKLFILTVVLVLFSNAARVLLPVLIAFAIDWTLPQVREEIGARWAGPEPDTSCAPSSAACCSPGTSPVRQRFPKPCSWICASRSSATPSG